MHSVTTPHRKTSLWITLTLAVALSGSIGTVSAQQDGQRHGGSAGHGGVTSPHGSEGGGSFGGASVEGGNLGGGGRSGFGYWGDRHVPGSTRTVPDDGTVPDVSAESGSGSSQGYGTEGILIGNCDTIPNENLKGVNRLKGINLGRINIVGAYLAKGVTIEKVQRSGSPRLNLANYQEELEKAEPDTTVAGIYLGLVSMVKVTPDLVNRVNAALCVKSSTQQSLAIANIAEEQRIAIGKPN